jgi:hypothetical protein
VFIAENRNEHSMIMEMSSVGAEISADRGGMSSVSGGISPEYAEMS